MRCGGVSCPIGEASRSHPVASDQLHRRSFTGFGAVIAGRVANYRVIRLCLFCEGLIHALARADEALADRRTFGLNAAQWKAFIAALDAPPCPLPRLKRLLKEPGFFDAGPNQ